MNKASIFNSVIEYIANVEPIEFYSLQINKLFPSSVCITRSDSVGNRKIAQGEILFGNNAGSFIDICSIYEREIIVDLPFLKDEAFDGDNISLKLGQTKINNSGARKTSEFSVSGIAGYVEVAICIGDGTVTGMVIRLRPDRPGQ